LLADEPTGNLDRATGQEVTALLEDLNAAGMTLIVVTHDPSMGARARRRLLMEDGFIRQDVRKPASPSLAADQPQTAP
ncbi:MAG TPA: macrolide ABC transporter ATP-binding protein, partial [candidate division Zixibacteria bacterium]|nr:macrolide ABC transporter ATP-binding protein [candidate division Zixibacteria bacterium]